MRSVNLEFERKTIKDTIQKESAQDVAGVLAEVEEYERARSQETLQQIALKQASTDKLLREEVILAVVRRANMRLGV